MQKILFLQGLQIEYYKEGSWSKLNESISPGDPGYEGVTVLFSESPHMELGKTWQNTAAVVSNLLLALTWPKSHKALLIASFCTGCDSSKWCNHWMGWAEKSHCKSTKFTGWPHLWYLWANGWPNAYWPP